MKTKNLFIKALFIVVLAFTMNQGVQAQGWVSQGSNRLYAVNQGLSLTPIRIGIGLNNPTAQFHTTGTVRFQGITQDDNTSRILTTDNNGNVFWRDANSLMPVNNSWLLNGNLGTNPANNFLGTIDNVALSFRTNNREKMRILEHTNPLVAGAGRVAIGSVQIPTELYVNSKDVCGGTMPIWVKGDIAGMNYNPGVGANNTLGRLIRLSQVTGATLNGFYDIGINSASDLYFSDLSYPTGVNPRQLFVIGHNDNVGVNLAFNTSPTANFHTNGTVRFENLPSGGGNYLVVDANGNVRVSTNTINARMASEDYTTMKSDLDKAKNEIEELKKIVAELQRSLAPTQATISQESVSSAVLYENIPNPFSSSTDIPYYLPEGSTNAKIVIFNNQGRIVKEIKITESGNNKITIYSNEFPSGIYTYSMFVDSQEVASKKMVVNQ